MTISATLDFRLGWRQYTGTSYLACEARSKRSRIEEVSTEVESLHDHGQDRDQKTPFSDSSHQWMRREFEKELFFIWDECAWKFQNGTGKSRWAEYEQHIQGHGNLGNVYPKYKYGVEGETPAFLHLLPLD